MSKHLLYICVHKSGQVLRATMLAQAWPGLYATHSPAGAEHPLLQSAQYAEGSHALEWDSVLGCMQWYCSAAPVQPCMYLAEDDTMDETAPEEVLLDGNAEARASDFYMPSGIEVRGLP